jgi:hypothetical protein
MSRRNVQLVILCEDSQHEVFIRRFLEKRGWSARRLRVRKAPSGRGSAEQFVREQYPKELAAYRQRRGHVEQAVVVMQDGDQSGVRRRLQALDAACVSQGVESRQGTERVAVFLPTWRIETWFAYLEGQTVDEANKAYPRLHRERDCKQHVDALDEMCRRQDLRQPAPASLQAACDEYRARLTTAG